MSHVSLLNPATLGTLSLRNRTLVAPMTRVSAEANGQVGPLMQPYYEAFGHGGFGAIITEGVYTDQEFSQGYQYQPGITDAAQAASWARLIKGVKATGAKVIMQLMHAGALSQFNAFSAQTGGPSAVQPLGEQMGIYRGTGQYKIPVAMSIEDIDTAKRGFVTSAKRAQDAGADGVEIHGANGYLLDQFLTAYSNQRGDCYGGTVENRIRLTCEILQEVRAAVGADFTVGVRISQSKVNDYAYKWAGGEADAAIIFAALQDHGADYIHIAAHSATDLEFDSGNSLAALAKAHSTLPVIANGGLGAFDAARQALAQAQCDFVAIGKQALASPDWPLKLATNTQPEAFDSALFSPLVDLTSAQKYWAQRP
jgi:2,4-dienoyl-CoA reductase-like NADH-dependent reductase (Old Yellow Enzyme family)